MVLTPRRMPAPVRKTVVENEVFLSLEEDRARGVFTGVGGMYLDSVGSGDGEGDEESWGGEGGGVT
jgi:hypothetical protein